MIVTFLQAVKNVRDRFPSLLLPGWSITVVAVAVVVVVVVVAVVVV